MNLFFSAVKESKKIRPPDAFVTSEGLFPYTRVHMARKGAMTYMYALRPLFQQVY